MPKTTKGYTNRPVPQDIQEEPTVVNDVWNTQGVQAYNARMRDLRNIKEQLEGFYALLDDIREGK